MPSFHQTIIMGNLGADPEYRVLDNGMAVVNLSVAVNESYKDKSGEWKDKTEWYRVKAFGERAERIQQRAFKGAPVHIVCRKQERSYEKDGQKQYITEFVADRCSVLVKSEGDAATGDGPPPNGQQARRQETRPQQNGQQRQQQNGNGQRGSWGRQAPKPSDGFGGGGTESFNMDDDMGDIPFAVDMTMVRSDRP